MINSMDKILIRYRGNRSSTLDKELLLPEFLKLRQNDLNSFESTVSDILKEIYISNKENILYLKFPRRKMPLTIDLVSSGIKSGWIAVYSPAKNIIRIANNLNKEDLKLALMHELKHAEQWFNDRKFNNYQRHQAFCLLEIYAKLFIGNFIGRGAYFNISLTEAIDKWFCKHYQNYKEKYDKQWPLRERLTGLKHLPKSFELSSKEEKNIIRMLNKKVLNRNNEYNKQEQKENGIKGV